MACKLQARSHVRLASAAIQLEKPWAQSYFLSKNKRGVQKHVFVLRKQGASNRS